MGIVGCAVCGCPNPAVPSNASEPRASSVADVAGYVLSMEGSVPEGIRRPPLQYLNIPMRNLPPRELARVDKLLSHLPQGGLIFARTVTAVVPFRPDAASENQSLQLSIGIAAAGWQHRMRLFADLAARAGRLKVALPSGLEPVWVRTDRAADGLGGLDFKAVDPELGFVLVHCSGQPPAQPVANRLARSDDLPCFVEALMTPYLRLSVALQRAQVPEWRARWLAARKAALGFVGAQPTASRAG